MTFEGGTSPLKELVFPYLCTAQSFGSRVYYRRTMSLYAMYQRIPYSTLSDISKKKPQNYAILKLPPSPNDRIAFANWERQSNAETTVTFDEARVNGYGFKDTSFAKWQTRTFPKDIDFESALERIEHSNNSEPRVLKYKLNFTDGCHILLTRADFLDPASLFCTEFYNPNGSFNKKTQVPPPPIRV